MPYSSTGVNGPFRTPQFTYSDSITRSNTVATPVAVLPKGSRITNIMLQNLGGANDAVTSSDVTATINTAVTGASTLFSAKSVKGVGAGVLASFQFQTFDSQCDESDITVSLRYSEVGAATVGGPYRLLISFLRT